MRRVLLIALVAVAVLAAGVASRAFPPPHRAAAAPQHQHRPQQEDRGQPHRVDVTVTGPGDTLMRVARGDARTQVALGGKPFRHAFTEPAGGTSYLGIAVAAASRTPTADRPVTCEIRVNGRVVASQSARELDEHGVAQVLCTIPAPI
ncbi:hypothetical protein [Prauserella muralis]|uniref:Uncharacterized protein n=1 Tax=Prauserella muralis TaxID=588067 RepID=A0A2V4B1A3_9PSEU|nr:hypothetical protein [Prauserella muralis]PXY22345.1 hypothetical protein BAY60_20980 [Prauserella muralis]TWE28000.1 hypothetical protein FHX69_0650 [Prauserella muralis]